MSFISTLLEKYREDDYLVTKVQYDFSGEVNTSLTVIVHHFRPTDEQQVIDNIYGRGQSEEIKLIAQKTIDEILPNINI